MGDIAPHTPVAACGAVCPIGSNRLSFSREKVLKLTYSKVETQICRGNAPDPPHQGSEKGERGEGGRVGERR